jgi:hypothetical protein
MFESDNRSIGNRRIASGLAAIKYLLRCRVNGMFEWICPVCGTFTRSSLRPQSYVVQCSGENCRRKYGVGHTLYFLPGGARMPPPDYILPDGIKEAFPRGETDAWQSGQTMHRVGSWERHDDTDTDTDG